MLRQSTGPTEGYTHLRWTPDMKSAWRALAVSVNRSHLSTRLNRSLLLGSPDRPYAPFSFPNVPMSDWGKTTLFFLVAVSLLMIRAEGSGDDSPARPIRNKPLTTKNKWEGEDEDDDGPVVSLA